MDQHRFAAQPGDGTLDGVGGLCLLADERYDLEVIEVRAASRRLFQAALRHSIELAGGGSKEEDDVAGRLRADFAIDEIGNQVYMAAAVLKGLEIYQAELDVGHGLRDLRHIP